MSEITWTFAFNFSGIQQGWYLHLLHMGKSWGGNMYFIIVKSVLNLKAKGMAWKTLVYQIYKIQKHIVTSLILIG